MKPLFAAALLLASCGPSEDDRDPVHAPPDGGSGVDGGPPPDDRPFALEMSVSNARDTSGQLCFAVFRDGQGYPDGEEAVANGCVAMTAQPALARLPAGRYGVSVFHDADSDGELGTSFLGIPSEGYGFSNDPSATFGPPPWDEVAFELAGDLSVEMTLTYF